jgi:hypothetical protein
MSLDTWKSALTGFLICGIATAAVLLIFYFSADAVASNLPNVDFRADLAEGLRRNVVSCAILLIASLGIYWAFAAICCKVNVLNIKWANYPLAAAWIIYMLLMANHHFILIDTFCDQFPQSHAGFSILRVTECPSSGMANGGLQVIAFLLALHSLVFRIVATRPTKVATA